MIFLLLGLDFIIMKSFIKYINRSRCRFSRKGFAQNALEYYRRMGENSDLQKKYAEQKTEVENLLNEILIKRGEKPLEI